MKIFKSSFLALISLLVIQCSTEKNSIIHRGFHNLHAKYNGFFNANELIKSTYNDFLKSRKEDYNTVIPIYPFTTKEESKNWYAPMDTAYRKCELVVFKHRMPHKKKGKYRNTEWGKYVDDNWLTLGKTRYYKHDFANALKIFQHIENKFPLEDNYFLSIFWQAKVLLEMQAYDESEEILLNLLVKYDDQEKNLKKPKKITFKEKINLLVDYDDRMEYLSSVDKKIPEKIIDEIYPTLGDLYVRSKNFNKAIEYLEIALDRKYKRSFKTRLTFILAQLYHIKGNNKASYYYQKVVESNPEYEMAFQAKINRALSFSEGDSKAIRMQLMKMLKDDKNIEYFDQIYFALAEISFKENERDLAIEQLQKSINLSFNDPQQKIKSMKRMGDLFYADADYINSFFYYDSIQKINLNKYPNKKDILKKYVLLNNIFLNTSTVENNDSLFSICKLSEDEKTEKLYEIADQLIAQKSKEDNSQLIASTSKRLSIPNSNSVLNSTFFIWDQSLLERGKNEFEKKWGKLPFGDNWRRSSRASLFVENEEETAAFSSNNVVFDELLKGLPCDNKSLMSSMKDSILLSLYNLGLIHHYETEDFLAAEKNFRRIVTNFQPSKESIASIYELYNIYKILNNKEQSSAMKKLLLEKYPQSQYTKLIFGEQGVSNFKNTINIEKKFYAGLYKEYQSGNFNFVLNNCNEKIKDSSNLLFCQYGILKAYTLKKLKDSSLNDNELIKTLKLVVNKCMGTDYGEQALSVLNSLKINSASKLMTKENWKFKYSPDTIHYFIMIAPKGGFKLNKAKNNIADFNMSNFSNLKLKVSNTFLNTSDQMILVKSFENSQSAMDYYLGFKVNKGNVKNYKNEIFFVLSPENLKELYRERNSVKYLKFFNEFYK